MRRLDLSVLVVRRVAVVEATLSCWLLVRRLGLLATLLVRIRVALLNLIGLVVRIAWLVWCIIAIGLTRIILLARVAIGLRATAHGSGRVDLNFVRDGRGVMLVHVGRVRRGQVCCQIWW